MGGVKGNSLTNVGYACMQRALIKGWRSVWSTVPGTTDPQAPFGIVTLASSGSEGGPNMGPCSFLCSFGPLIPAVFPLIRILHREGGAALSGFIMSFFFTF